MKKSKNKIFGWLFVAYPVITILLPIIAAIVITVLGIEIGEDRGPASDSFILRHLGVSSTIIYSLGGMALIVGLICPAIIFISGIFLLKNKKSGIKLAQIAFVADFIFRFFYVVIGYSNIYTKRFYFSAPNKMIVFYIFFLIDLYVIYYFTKRKGEILE